MPLTETGVRRLGFSLIKPDLPDIQTIDRDVIVEAPIAIEYNGIGYAVMMGTPIDLTDFAIGFSLSEQLVDTASQIQSIAVHHAEQGWIIRIQLPPVKINKVVDRARQRVSESSCGLCGMDNLDEVMRPLAAVTAGSVPSKISIFKALDGLRSHQVLNARTGACHAAAYCNADGSIQLTREDVGRHNAFDKLLGAMTQMGLAASGGFVMLTARCSFELVQKAIIANCQALVTVSAATTLAIETAERHGLPLISLARPDGVLGAPNCAE
jgi:FdhD protein